MDDDGSLPGWLLLPPAAVPEPWVGRAVDMVLVPLLPGEVRRLLRGEAAAPEIVGEDVRIATLVARGQSVRQIADAVGRAPRTVERRIAVLRQRLGVRTTTQLVGELARRGF